MVLGPALIALEKSCTCNILVAVVTSSDGPSC